MSLQLILGNSGSGKTHTLYEEIIQQSMEYPKKQFLIIVPEQYTMKTQKELAMRHPRGGILNIDVLSFGRLAHRVFGELGTDVGMILDDEGKNLVLRKIAGDYEKDLKVIGKNLKKFGYISEVKSVISEFTQYDIDLNRVEELKNQVGEGSMLSYKLEDIYKIYQGFREHLQGRYITGEELLDSLTKVLEQSDIVRDSVIAIDGFTGFTPVQNRLLGRLMEVASKIYVTVTIDGNENPYSYGNPYQLFALSKETVCTMMELGRSRGIEIEEPLCLFHKPTYRYRNNEAMAFLEENIFRYGGKKYESEQEVISIHEMKNPEEESRWIASKIRQLVRKKGYRYRDIAVITSSVEAYGRYLKKYCGLYNVPIFMDETRSILLNSFVEYIRSLLSMIEENYSYNAAFRYIKSNTIDGCIDDLENYVLEFGLRGYKKWNESWTLTSRNLSEQQLEYLNSYRQKFMEQHEPLRSTLKKRNKTVKDISVALYEHLEQNHLQRKIEEQTAYFEEQGLLALEKEYSQIYGVVIELLDKLVGILGDEQVSLKEFMELLDAGLQEARIGVIPPSMDEVLIGDLQRTRIDHVKALFFVGVSDAYLPGNMSGSGFLTEQDREVLMGKQVRLKPGSKEQMYLQKFYLYMNLTKPTERLFLSYAKSGADGKSARPSYIVGEFRKLFPNIVCHEVGFELDSENELTDKVGLPYIIQGLHNPEQLDMNRWKELYAWYANHPDRYEALEQVVDGYFYKRIQENLSEELARELYGKVLKNSVSRLEKFAACPYAHFLNYGLKVRERELYEFEASDVGTVLHDALKEFACHVKDSEKDWKTLTTEEQELWANEAVDKVVEEYKHGLFHQSQRDEYMIARFRRMMSRTVWSVVEQLKAGAFVPEEFEVGFGVYKEGEPDQEDGIWLSQDQVMKLGGFIDRIDICKREDKVLVKIVDYKSSAKDVDLNDLYYGLQMQLFVYMNEALKLEKALNPDKEVIPAGGFYYHIDDPIVEEKSKKTVEEVMLEERKVAGLVNEVAVKDMDEDFEYTSSVIPVKRTKSTGEWDKSSKNIPQKDLEDILEFTNQKIMELGQNIAGGNIEISPYRYKDPSKTQEGCTYCEYKRICGFDHGSSGYEYHQLEKLSKEEVMEKIKERNL